MTTEISEVQTTLALVEVVQEHFSHGAKILPAKFIAPINGLTDLFKKIKSLKKLPPDCIGLTSDNKLIFSGRLLFELKATHGFPLDFALDKIINDNNMAVDWVEFIETARANKWWDFQTHEVLTHALIDAQVDKELKDQILLRFQLYVLQNKHPNQSGN